MAGKINVTPAEMQLIINSVSDMRNKIIEASNKLKNQTVSIQRVWHDDAFDVFKGTVSNFHRQLGIMSDQLEKEKERLQKYQRDARNTIDGYKM